jgi:protein TonB
MRFPITPTPRIKKFVVVSALLHLTAMTTYELFPPEEPPEVKKSAPVKVKYVPEQPKPEPKKPPQFVETVEPKEIVPPKEAELISNANSKANSKIKKNEDKLYAAKQTLIPQPKRETIPEPQERVLKKDFLIPPPKEKREVFREAETGFETPKEQAAPKKQVATKYSESTMALLDGFDPSEYASLETRSQEASEVDEEEVISLNTKETKYASYFQRIKRQIERVWSYPEEAARHGINGRLSLRFRIARDGHLMDVRLVDPSGSNLLDDAAVNAVKGAAPYYPFPVTIDRDTLSILATFIYSPAYSSYYQEKHRK